METGGFTFTDSLDKDHLDMIYEGDAERASVIFAIFLNNIDEELALLEKLEKENSGEEFIRKIHKMAPNFSMVGLSHETELLIEIEADGKTFGLTATLREKFHNFTSQLVPKLATVKEELRRINEHLEQ